jgi:hypothetical protein
LQRAFNAARWQFASGLFRCHAECDGTFGFIGNNGEAALAGKVCQPGKRSTIEPT